MICRRVPIGPESSEAKVHSRFWAYVGLRVFFDQLAFFSSQVYDRMGVCDTAEATLLEFLEVYM